MPLAIWCRCEEAESEPPSTAQEKVWIRTELYQENMETRWDEYFACFSQLIYGNVTEGIKIQTWPS